mmetsp:Transcript_6970/g.19221  ORF Transcript_6970/g.19221 Transcript_6970/m.19221 type:complete len:162 (-) Transcript_6970:94-579(-)
MVATTWASVACKLNLLNKSYGENDEGDYDFYSVFELTYGDVKPGGTSGSAVLWGGRQTRSSNVAGAWGHQMSASLSEDRKTLLVRITNVNERLGGWHENTKVSEERLSVCDLLVKAGVLTSEEIQDLRDGGVAKDDDYVPAVASVEQGSTWRLHHDPFQAS